MMTMNFDPFRDLDRMAQALASTARGPQLMPMDVYRDGDHYVLTTDLPGVDPGSVDVDVDGQLLTIRAERTLRRHDGVRWLAQERAGGSYLRQVSLGQGIDTERIVATYEHGVLTVTLPVSERAKPRKIAIGTGTQAEQGALAN